MAATPPQPAPTVNPLELGLTLAGAAVLAASTFLPMYDNSTGGNTMFQRGGWLLLVYAALIAVAGWFAVRKPRRWPLPLSVAILAAGNLTFMFADAGEQSPGIAVYAAIAGIAIAVIGSLLLRRKAT